MDIQLYNRISEKDFERYREKYGEFQKECIQSLIFRVGLGAGVFYELGGMLEAIAWCYEHKIR